MNKDRRAMVIIGSFFPIMFTLALLLSQPYKTAGFTTNATQSDPANIVVMVVVMAIGTLVFLFIPIKFEHEDLLRAVLIALISYSMFDISTVLFSPYLISVYVTAISTASVLVVALLLIYRPEWYVIDVTAVLIGASATATLGMSLSVLLVIILLVGLLIYDAFSVYKSKHMVKLAKNVMKLRLPAVVIIPTTLPYSYLNQEDPFSDKAKGKAHIMGLGDLVFPGILVVSVQSNIQNPIVTLSTAVGTMLGYVGVSFFVSKGKPQAGLPFLCSGAIVGFVISSLVIYGRLMI
jgi:presenilin-like A22 family membrane protease